MRDVPPRPAAAEDAADDALRDRQEGRRGGGGREIPGSAQYRHAVGALQFRRVGDQRAGQAAGGRQGHRIGDRDPGDERRGLPEVAGDRFPDRRASPDARRERSGAGELSEGARQGAGPSGREGADRRALQMTRARAWLAVWGGWTALALFFAASTSLTYRATGRPANWALSLERSLSQWWLWALATPGIVALSRRFPIHRPHGARNLAVHAATGAAVAFAQLAADRAVFAMLTGFWTYMLASTWALNVVVYAAIVAAAHGVEYYRRSRERDQLEARLAETRLQLLGMQLQPHFLFNTLNTIAELVHEDADLADLMISRLSDLLRRTLEFGGAQRIPLEEEIDLVSRYIDIQKARFGDRLQIDVTVDPAAAGMLVPALLLQPVVENSIRHGLGTRLDAGRIAIRASAAAGRLVIVVSDDGNGDAAGPERVGLGNTRARLEALYGSRARLTLAPREDRGMRVTIEIPDETPEPGP